MPRTLPVPALLPAALLTFPALGSSYVGAGGPIPDALDLKGPPGEIISEVIVTEAIVPESLSVTVTDLAHTWCGDLIIRLTHLPSGSTQSLLHRIGVPLNPPPNVFGDSSNFGGDYVFIDGGADLWLAAGGGGTNFVIPSGNYRASSAGSGLAVPLLGAFAGIDASGPWRLTVQDAAAGDAGSFLSWTLTLTGLPVPLCPTLESCFEPHPTPGCSSAACCAAVCAVDASCCELAWDDACALQALTACRGCGEPAAGDCCSAHAGQGCSEQACCEAICLLDISCCESAWDELCAEAARANLACDCPTCPGTGSCFEPHGGLGCEDEACCGAVCAAAPTCCEQAWDLLCAGDALVLCGGCGEIDSGECCAAHASPGCSELACCEAVCAVDLQCCISAWDLSCVASAAAIPVCACPAPCEVAQGCCYTAHAEVGCSDSKCCASVCTIDSSCCDQAWDTSCAALAFSLCCPSDLNADGRVDGADLGLLLESLFIPGQGGGPTDFDCNGTVDSGDLGILLSSWGKC